jgi:hypothetical protein
MKRTNLLLAALLAGSLAAPSAMAKSAGTTKVKPSAVHKTEKRAKKNADAQKAPRKRAAKRVKTPAEAV